MSNWRPIPWPGIILALAGAAGIVLSGASASLAFAIFVLWSATLWLRRPEAPALTPITDSVKITRDSMRELIENSGLPLLMLDRNRIVVANSAAREALGRHIVGQDAKVGLRHPSAVELLERRQGGTATIRGLTGPRSIWQMNRQPVDERYAMIELINRTAEADISRAHTDFVANASHELRTPLASIIGYVETLADKGEDVDRETAKRFYDTVLREAKRLQNLVEDLMSLSRVEAEKHDQPSEKIELNGLVSQAAREAGPIEDKARVVIEKANRPLPIRGDRRQLEQLVRNLVDNALKYGDPSEVVTVSLSLDARGYAQLEVKDRGEGIAPEHIPHLTRRFYRTDPGRSRAAGGTGLGLAIVKHIVERHRGRLDITSKQGHGTTVAVRFPTLVEDADNLS